MSDSRFNEGLSSQDKKTADQPNKKSKIPPWLKPSGATPQMDTTTTPVEHKPSSGVGSGSSSLKKKLEKHQEMEELKRRKESVKELVAQVVSEFDDDRHFASEMRIRKGREATVPENFHNRPLIPTTTNRNNCAIDAIAMSDNAHRTLKERRQIVSEAKEWMVTKGYVGQDEAIDLNKVTEDGSIQGEELLSFLSQKGYIRENAGLTVHYQLPYEALSDHMQTVPGDQIHIYQEVDVAYLPHFWGMGPEIEPGAWAPDPKATFQRMSQQTEEEQLLERAIKLSKQVP